MSLPVEFLSGADADLQQIFNRFEDYREGFGVELMTVIDAYLARIPAREEVKVPAIPDLAVFHPPAPQKIGEVNPKTAWIVSARQRTDASNVYHSFLRAVGGTITTFDAPRRGGQAGARARLLRTSTPQA